MAIHNTVTARYSAEATTWFCPHQIGQHSGRAVRPAGEIVDSPPT